MQHQQQAGGEHWGESGNEYKCEDGEVLDNACSLIISLGGFNWHLLLQDMLQLFHLWLATTGLWLAYDIFMTFHIFFHMAHTVTVALSPLCSTVLFYMICDWITPGPFSIHRILTLLLNLVSLRHLKWLTMIYDDDLDILREYWKNTEELIHMWRKMSQVSQIHHWTLRHG